MSSHEFDRLTERQRAALLDIAFGGQGEGFAPRTLAALRDKGLVEHTMAAVGRDRFGTIEVPRYWVPLAVHVRVCQWCAGQDSRGAA